jgi:SAM-dependent methyltransferase
MSSQRDTFLAGEGDAWFSRNEAALRDRDWSRDPVARKVAELAGGRGSRILEVGCGDGSRLEWLRGQGHEVAGLDPSARAVARARERGVTAVQGTADALEFADASFDFVIYGFCLYLCDDADLFRIAQQGDRVLRSPGWLLILDFDAASPLYRPYHHSPGMMSRKMNYQSMFAWHPSYSLAGYEKFDHASLRWTDDPQEWVSLACLRKNPRSR